MINFLLFKIKFLILRLKVYFDKNGHIDEYHYKLIVLPFAVATLAASFSPDNRLKVGSVLFKGSKIFNSNFNSRPVLDRNYDNCVNLETNKSCNELLHSEVKTILNSMINIKKVNPSLLITHAPCLKCASVILESGITDVWFCNEHDNNEGVIFLKKNGVIVHDYTSQLIPLTRFYKRVFISLILHNNIININKIRNLIY